MMPETTRITTSARDLIATRARLRAWLTRRLPVGAEPLVAELSAPASNGMSNETLLFDVTRRVGVTSRTESYVARLAPEPSAVPVFPVYDLERQFTVMRLVAQHTSVPVPHVYWFEPDPEPLGQPFFVMERVDGQVPPDVMPYNFGDSWLSRASAHEQRQIQDSTIAVIAELHRIERPETVFGFLGVDRDDGSHLRRHVTDQWAYYRWAFGDGAPSPLIEACFAWLEQHWPAEEGPTSLCWGDARIGNIMFRDWKPVAVLDWEMAALGPPEVDLAWCIYLHRFFEDLAGGYGLAGMPEFLTRDDVAATYASLTGYQPRDLDFYTMYAALRHGIIMSRTARRSIHFGEAEMPEDVDDLILHRATLEAMLAGTYWP